MLSLGITPVLADFPVAALYIANGFYLFQRLLTEPLWILVLSLSIFNILFAQLEKLDSFVLRSFCLFCFIFVAALLKFLVDDLTLIRPVGEPFIGLTLYSFYLRGIMESHESKLFSANSLKVLERGNGIFELFDCLVVSISTIYCYLFFSTLPPRTTAEEYRLFVMELGVLLTDSRVTFDRKEACLRPIFSFEVDHLS